MDAGAFSDEKVLESAKGLVMILVDCTSRAQNTEYKKKYEVRGYPTIAFCDPKGKKTGELQGRDPYTVASQFKNHAEKYTLTIDWAKSIDKAIERSKKDAKPTLVFISNEKKKATPVVAGLFFEEDLKPTLERFVLSRIEFEKGSDLTEKMRLNGQAAVYILDPTLEDPYKKPILRIKKFKSPGKFKKDLVKALKSWDKAQAKKETAHK